MDNTTAPRQVSAFASMVTAPNAGPMTLDGTNSYLLRFPGSESVVVVDPGPADEDHLQLLAGQGPVELILVTHRHSDHTEGIDRLHEITGAPVRAVLPEHCRAAEPLADRDTVRAAGLEVLVLATPGHTSDSVCFLVQDDGPHGAMLTGDTILGRGTTILDFPDGTLGDYLASLDLLAGFGSARLLPAHGPVHPDLHDVVVQYQAHRRERLDQVRAALHAIAEQQANAGGQPGASGQANAGGQPRASGQANAGGQSAAEAASVAQVADVVYADVDPSVRGAAEHSVAAQLHYLRGAAEAADRGNH